MSKKATSPKEFNLEDNIVRVQGLLIATAVLAHGCNSFNEQEINDAASATAEIGCEILEDILVHFSEGNVR